MAEAEKKKKGIWSRRDFFTRLGWGGFGIFGGLTLLGFPQVGISASAFSAPVNLQSRIANRLRYW